MSFSQVNPTSGHPSRGEEELEDLLALGRGAPLPQTPLRAVSELIAEQAQTNPHAIAVSSSGENVSYGTLSLRASRLARRLAKAGVERGSRVGVLVDPSAAMVTAVLGILWRGAAYVPIDGAESDRRIAEVLADADVTAVVADKRAERRLAAAGVHVVPLESKDDPTAAILPRVPAALDDPAYIIYTSGSTGEPKGVLIEHGQLAASTAARTAVYEGRPVFLLLSPLAFDSSVAGLWSTLAMGGRVVVATKAELQDIERLARLIPAERVTRLLCIPSLYAVLMDAAERLGVLPLRTLETVIVAGEPLPPSLVKRHFALHGQSVALVNEYGPTEATVWASFHRFDRPEPVSIGGPIPGASLYVLDDDLRPVQRGELGELFIGGAGVASGYIGRPDATAAAFLDDPFSATPGARMYRTGDLARWNESGLLEFLGRRDQQVKVRGHRIELGAIEGVLRGAPGVSDAVVIANDEQTALLAFVVAAQGITAEALRLRSAELLSPVMVPSRIKLVKSFPLTVGGKVDRRRLRELAVDPTCPSAAAGSVHVTATSDVRASVASAWAEVLRTDQIPHDINFFDIGGHSLTMFQLQDALERHTGIRPSVVDLFRYTTVSTQAEVIGRAGIGGAVMPSEDVGDDVRTKHSDGRARGNAALRGASCLDCAVPKPEAARILLFFPHAGGSPSLARDWGEELLDIEVYGVCYPGRGRRIGEPVPTDLRNLAAEIAEAAEQLGDRPLALFGHSMGAAVALETARLLEAARVDVTHLFASGSREGECVPIDPPPDQERDPNAVVEQLVRLGGTDPELAADPDFRELVLPYVLGDGWMFHAYRMEEEPLLRCPITTIVGDIDIDADRRPWSRLTSGRVREHVVTGDHFYLQVNPPFALIRAEFGEAE